MSQPDLLVTGAGGGGSSNLIRGLKRIDYDGKIIGSNVDRYYLSQSNADENYLIPRGDESGYEAAIENIVSEEDIDLIIPNNGTEVRAISEIRDEIPAKVFLPLHDDIVLCQDKYDLGTHLQQRDVPTPESRAVEDLDDLDAYFRDLDGDLFWCRLRRGSGSKGATKVRTVDQARSWIEYWDDMRDVNAENYTINEYLPGKDYAFQSIWCDGELILSKTLERLTYIGAESRASGQSSSPQVGKLLYDETVQQTCERAIRAVNPNATGMYSVDLKENEAGVPHVTEINIGRFCMITNAFNEVGEHNMTEVYTELAFDEVRDIERPRKDIGDETWYLVRELDTLPSLLTEEEIEHRYERLVD